MCGITGFLQLHGVSSFADPARVIKSMSDTLVHRGPDSSGDWTDPAAGVALGHRRLAIVDLTPAGHQPMISADGRWVVTYNGEIYNFRELRQELENTGCRFRGHSDTEVMLEMVARRGVDATIVRLVGMFAIAFWDRQERHLYLVRDRLGVKPLYWTVQAGCLLFASELKALRVHPSWSATLDVEAADAMLRFSYIPGPATIYRDVFKLPPGSVLRACLGREHSITPYWTLLSAVQRGLAGRFSGSIEDATDRLDHLLRDVVSRRMVADVPLGAFLSGGIDSSVVVAQMQASSTVPVRTFSIGFHESGYDEAVHAKAVARHLGTDHTEFYLDAAAAKAVIPKLPAMFDEPFGDSSQIPTFLVAEMTRRHVTVALSGDGGDELFGGYPRYQAVDTIWRKLRGMPGWSRRGLGALLRAIPAGQWDRILQAFPWKSRPARSGEKVHRVARILDARTADEFYQMVMTQREAQSGLVPAAKGTIGLGLSKALAAVLPDFVERMQYFDTMTYLAEDIMAKVDRTTMAVSLEAREPLLDHRLVEFAWTLPKQYKFANGQGKWLLRQVLFRYVPLELVERPKMGFSIPIDEWLRGVLREWAEDLLDEQRLQADGLLASSIVRRLWSEHQARVRNHSTIFWNLLMLQAWRRYNQV